jgi:protein-S-isoprenylcysteine O-methyltransferase Ste14
VANTSPEPVSNVVLSTAEDVVTGGLLYLAYTNPVLAGGIAMVLLMLAIWLLLWARRVFKRIFGRGAAPEPPVIGDSP